MNIIMLIQDIICEVGVQMTTDLTTAIENIQLASKTLADPFEESPFARDEKIKKAQEYLKTAENACESMAEIVKRLQSPTTTRSQ